MKTGPDLAHRKFSSTAITCGIVGVAHATVTALLPVERDGSAAARSPPVSRETISSWNRVLLIGWDVGAVQPPPAAPAVSRGPGNHPGPQTARIDGIVLAAWIMPASGTGGTLPFSLKLAITIP